MPCSRPDGEASICTGGWGGRGRLVAGQGTGMACVRPAFDGGFGHQERIGRFLVLDCRLVTAHECAADQQGGPTDMLEFPPHLSPHVRLEVCRGIAELRNSTPSFVLR